MTTTNKTDKKIKVLVADDDIDCIEQVELMLAGDEYDVTAVQSRAQAEDILRTLEPDVAVFDLMMEEQDSGFILSHKLKRLHPGTKVILLTSVTAATGVSFRSEGTLGSQWIKADIMLDKPVRAEQLRGAIHRLLRA